MISWHRVGQKVATIGDGWARRYGGDPSSGPLDGHVCTISAVEVHERIVTFALSEWPTGDWYAHHRFRPVYPDIIDQLRNLDAPIPGEPSKPVRVKEGV